MNFSHVVIILMLFIGLSGIVKLLSNSENKSSELMSRYVEHMYSLKDVKILCGTHDTDANGYVRLTAIGQDKNNSERTIHMECPAFGSFSSNCVPIKGNVVR